jgi:hypothetical protein
VPLDISPWAEIGAKSDNTISSLSMNRSMQTLNRRRTDNKKAKGKNRIGQTPIFQQYFSYIMATSFSGGGSRCTRRDSPTMGKQLVSFITCGYESSAPFL